MSDTNGITDDPMENGNTSIDSVKEENDKEEEIEEISDESMEIEEEQQIKKEETVEKSEKKQEKQEEEKEQEEETPVKIEEEKEEELEEKPVKEEKETEKEDDVPDSPEETIDEKPEVKDEAEETPEVSEDKDEEMEEEKPKESVEKEKKSVEKEAEKDEKEQEEKAKKEEKTPRKEEKKEPVREEKVREKSEKPEKPEKSPSKTNEKSSPDARRREEQLRKNKQSPKKRENNPSGKLTNREHILDHIEIKRDATNRVKLYVLCDQRIWEDRGTGHVVTYQMPVEEGQPSNAGNTMVLVRLEGQNKNMLESRILMDTVYQKQQETLIVWSETDVMDLALSFQEKTGCEELWQKICEVQGRDPGDPEHTFDDGDDSDAGDIGTTSRVSLPPIEIGRLSELEALLHMHLASNSAREKMTMAIENDEVVSKLCEVFKMCEDIEHTEGLRTFYSIVKNLFMLNRNTVIEMLLDDKHIKAIIGMFEHDPAYKFPRRHREFVYEKAKYREVLNITAPELREKIHRLYRAQYIQDACLPSLGLFEENLLSTLGSHVFFCRVDIVSMLQKDKKAMQELFGQLNSYDTEVLRRRDLVLFLKEMISLSTSIPANGPAANKETFFKLQSMFNNEMLESLEPAFTSPDHETRAAMVDILRVLVDSSSQTIRDFLLRQSRTKENNEDVLLNRMIQHVLTDIDVHLTSGSEMILIMKTLLDPETMASTKTDRSEFLLLFYNRCFDTLIKPMLENVSGGIIKKDDYMMANRQSVVLRLLTFCVEHHSFSMRTRCVNQDLMNKILVLLKSKHSFLVLSALKMLQRVVTVKDDKYVRYLVREKVLDPVMECFRKNGNRYNIINSAVLHLFDFVKSEDVRPLIKYVVENHMEVIENVNYVKTFKEIKIRYDQHRDREETMSVRSEDNSMASPRSARKERNEDQWFDDDEDLEVGTASESAEKDVLTVSPVKKEEAGQRKTGIEPMFPSVLKRKNAIDEDEAAPVFGGGAVNALTDKKIVIKVHSERSQSPSPSPLSSPRTSSSPSPGPSGENEVTSSQNNKESSPTPTVKSLVDYDESDDSDEELPSPDAVPSSSTGSPENEKNDSGEKVVKEGKKLDSPEYNDVSSTSNEEKFETSENGGDGSTMVSEISRKRTSDGCDPVDAKRIRTDESSSPPPKSNVSEA
ncbi:unnamed protein product [Caenorhabditis brenneri]